MKKNIITAKNGLQALEWTEKLIDEFEFSPKWINKYIVLCVENGKADKALEYIKQRPYIRRFLKKDSLIPAVRKVTANNEPNDALIQLVEFCGITV